MSDLDISEVDILGTAAAELRQEKRRKAIELEKERLRRREERMMRIFPYRVTLERRDDPRNDKRTLGWLDLALLFVCLCCRIKIKMEVKP